MKLIIEIPEELYKECQGDVYYPDTGGELWQAVRNGVSLGKIKAEIDHDLKDAPYLYDEEHLDELYGFQDGIEHVLHIIDKHIGGIDKWK